jgi:hypothetical protein
MVQTYSLGEIVQGKSRLGRTSSGRYQIVGLIPREIPHDDQVLYRIRSVVTGVEWVAAHDKIEPVTVAPSSAAR